MSPVLTAYLFQAATLVRGAWLAAVPVVASWKCSCGQWNGDSAQSCSNCGESR